MSDRCLNPDDAQDSCAQQCVCIAGQEPICIKAPSQHSCATSNIGDLAVNSPIVDEDVTRAAVLVLVP